MDNITLKKINGLKTYFIHQPGAKSCSVQFWFRAGSSLEKGKDKGIAHFLEHMFFKGTKKRPGAKIAHEVESFGGEINAFTSFDYTCYYINAPKIQLGKTTEILMDMVSNPLFDKSELIPEREVVFEEYRRSLDNPAHYHFHHIQENTFSNGYNHPILGSAKTIKAFSREQLVRFRKDYYNTSNAALLIAGDLKSLSKLEGTIKKYKLPKGPKSQFNKFKIKDSAQNIQVHNKDVKQATLTMTIQAPTYESKKGAAEDLAINCFAYGESSYLHQKLVKESSLATLTSGSTMFFADGGAHFIKLAYPTENHEKVCTEFANLIHLIKQNKFQDSDVTKIKNQYVASKIYEKENLETFSFSIGHSFAQNENIEAEKEFIANIEKTHVSEVNKSFNDILKRCIHFSLQLPEGEKAEPYKAVLTKFEKAIKKEITPIKSKTGIKSKFDSQVELVKLKPGLSLLYRYNPSLPTFVLHGYIKGGLSQESAANCGSHYLLGRSLCYGHENKEYMKLKLELDNKSASLMGFSGKNAYGLTLHGLSRNHDSLVEDFFGTFYQPILPEKYIQLEKEMIERYIENSEKDPVKQCFRNFQKYIFKKNPYALDLTGNKDTLKNLSHTSSLDLHKKNLAENEILITYCGDQRFEQISQMVQQYSQHLTDKDETIAKEFDPDHGSHKMHLDFDREQVQIFIGMPGLALNNDNDQYLKLLTQYLSGQSSELFVEVRDRQGLCYATQPIHHTALQAGYWGIYIGSGQEKAKRAIEAIESILNRISDQGLPEREVERLKKMIIGSQCLQLQSNEDYANHYSIPALHGLGIDFENKRLDEIKEIDPKKFNKFLKDFLAQPRTIITAGPQI